MKATSKHVIKIWSAKNHK